MTTSLSTSIGQKQETWLSSLLGSQTFWVFIAMSLGVLGVLATAIDNACTALEAGAVGWTFRPLDADAMRAAFDATMKDPAFLKEAERMGFDVDPFTGAEMAQLITEMNNSPKEIVNAVADFIQMPK